MKISQTLLCITAVALLGCTCSASPRQVQNIDFAIKLSLTGPNTPCVIKFEPVGNLIFLPGTLNGQDSCWFILDTGFPYSLVNRDRLNSAHFKLGSVRLDAQPGGEVESQPVFDIAISIGDLSLTADSLRCYPLSGLEPIIGHRFDGIIGHDLFEKFVVSIDYLASTVSIEKADEFSYSGSGRVVEVIVEDGEPFIIAEVKHPDGTWRKAKLKLDTGSSDFIGFNGSYVQAENLVPDNQPQIPVLGMAVGGQTDNWVTRLEEFRVGDITFSNPVVGYSVDTLRSGDAGTIGAEFLRRFTVIFDYPRDRIILEPNENFNNDFVWDMSGIFPIAEAPDFGTKIVMAVQPGSPADEVGIVAGDILAKIEAFGCREISISDIRTRFTKAGEVNLLVQRGQSTREVVMMLKPQI
jgi:hypothetical protein